MRINLLPKEERPLSPKTLRWQFVVAFLGVVLLAVVTVLGFISQSHLTSLEEQVHTAKHYTKILQGQKRLVDSLQSEIQALKAKQVQLETLITQEEPGIGEALKNIVEQDLAGLWIEDVVYKNQGFSVKGYTFEMWSLSSYLSNLNSSGWHSLVTQLDQDSNTGFVTFVLDIGKGAVE